MAKPDTRDPLVKAIEFIGGRIVGRLGEDHAAGRQLQAEVNRLRVGAEALDSANASRSPLDTPSAHAMKVAKRARAYNAVVTETINRAGQAWASGYADVQRRIAEKVDLRPDAFAQEIRATFRTLSPAKQGELIKALVDGNRGPELAAIVKAPSVLTGITDEMRTAYEQMILGRHASAELEELEMLEEAYQSVSAATRAAGDLVKGFTDPAKLTAIESAAAEAEAADASFNQAIAPQ